MRQDTIPAGLPVFFRMRREPATMMRCQNEHLSISRSQTSPCMRNRIGRLSFLRDMGVHDW